MSAIGLEINQCRDYPPTAIPPCQVRSQLILRKQATAAHAAAPLRARGVAPTSALSPPQTLYNSGNRSAKVPIHSPTSMPDRCQPPGDVPLSDSIIALVYQPFPPISSRAGQGLNTTPYASRSHLIWYASECRSPLPRGDPM
jgi:hypothetical protein